MKHFYVRVCNKYGVTEFGQRVLANTGKEAVIELLKCPYVVVDDRYRIEVEELF